MPAPEVVSLEGNMRNDGHGAALQALAEQREELTPAVLAEMLYSAFEEKVEELNQRGVSLPPPTDMNGNVMTGYEGQMMHVASNGARGGAMMPSASEKAIASLEEFREDMLHEFASVSQDPAQATKLAMRIQKIEADIISMGGEVERFDPSQYQSGLKPVEQAVDQKDAAEKVVANTRQAYTLKPIREIFAGNNKSGKRGILVKIASAPGLCVRGTVVPKVAFTGNEVIDYVPDSGRGRMTVKMAKNGYWEDVSGNFDIAWVVENHD